MFGKYRVRLWWCAAASAAVMALWTAAAATAAEQEKSRQVTLDPPRSVDLRSAPEIPAVPRPADLVTNRPTMPMADYIAAKSAAAARQTPEQSRPDAAAPPPATGVSLAVQVPGANEAQTTGGNQFPPDADIATSKDWMVQVTNDQVVMYNWNTNAYKQVNLNTFFGSSFFYFHAPRVIHDPYWDRFVVYATGCNPCSGSSSHSGTFIGVSRTGDPSGAWWLWYACCYDPGFVVDFPQLGMDHDAVIVTYNVFTNNAFVWSVLQAYYKAKIYNGIGGAQGSSWSGWTCSMAPPYVLDNNPVSYVLSFCPGAKSVAIGSLTNSGRWNANLNLPDNTVDVTHNGLPPDASQPGTSYTLATGDNRFENRSLQVGNRIINTATINDGNLPTPALYTFDIGASPHTLVSDGVFFASGTSFDWHPSIVANTVAAPSGTPLGEVFVTWMSTDPNHNVNLQLRAGGGLGDNPSIGSGIPVFTSPQPLTGQTDASGVHRSGDYTSITTYPAAAQGCQADEVGLLTGEVAAATAGLWATRVGIVKHC